MSENDEMVDSVKGVGNIVVSVKHGTENIHVRFTYKAGDTLEEVVTKEGEEVILFNYYAGIKKAMRNKLSVLVSRTDNKGNFTGLSSEAAIAEMQNWRPAYVKLRTKKSDIDKMLEEKTPEELEAMIIELQKIQIGEI